MKKMIITEASDPKDAQGHIDIMSSMWIEMRSAWPEVPEDYLVMCMMSSISKCFPQVHGGLCARENITYSQICEALARNDSTSSSTSL